MMCQCRSTAIFLIFLLYFLIFLLYFYFTYKKNKRNCNKSNLQLAQKANPHPTFKYFDTSQQNQLATRNERFFLPRWWRRSSLLGSKKGDDTFNKSTWIWSGSDRILCLCDSRISCYSREQIVQKANIRWKKMKKEKESKFTATAATAPKIRGKLSMHFSAHDEMCSFRQTLFAQVI